VGSRDNLRQLRWVDECFTKFSLVEGSTEDCVTSR